MPCEIIGFSAANQISRLKIMARLEASPRKPGRQTAASQAQGFGARKIDVRPFDYTHAPTGEGIVLTR